MEGTIWDYELVKELFDDIFMSGFKKLRMSAYSGQF